MGFTEGNRVTSPRLAGACGTVVGEAGVYLLVRWDDGWTTNEFFHDLEPLTS